PGLDNVEFRLAFELFDQGFAQVRIVVYNKDASLIHCSLRSCASVDQDHIIATCFWPANHIGVIRLKGTPALRKKLQRREIEPAISAAQTGPNQPAHALRPWQLRFQNP